MSKELISSEGGSTRAIARGALLSVIVVMLAIAGFLLWVGIDTGFPGLSPYPPRAKLGALQSSHRLKQELERRLSDGADDKELLENLPWQEVLTHWHAPEDVSIERLEHNGQEVTAGSFHFRAVNDEGEFVFDLETGKFRQ